MGEPPVMPTHISSNGVEIWEWAAKLSEFQQRQDRARQLNADIIRIGIECGSCRHWMTRQCPRERNVNGRNHGPSMKAPKCGQFVMDSTHENIRQRWVEDLAALATQQEASR